MSLLKTYLPYTVILIVLMYLFLSAQSYYEYIRNKYSLLEKKARLYESYTKLHCWSCRLIYSQLVLPARPRQYCKINFDHHYFTHDWSKYQVIQ